MQYNDDSRVLRGDLGKPDKEASQPHELKPYIYGKQKGRWQTPLNCL
jgi:hypothetical protein